MMGIFRSREPKKGYEEQFLEENPIGTYADFPEEEVDFIIQAEATVLESEAWYLNQQAFIGYIRQIDFKESPNWQGYADLEDWQLAYVMDCYFTIDMELVARRTHVDEIDLNLDETALQFLSKIYLSRAVEADSSDPAVMLETALDLMENDKKNGTLEIKGSMVRWLNDQ
jgi:hypothetical protein